MIRVVQPPDHYAQRRLPDGRLWCGHDPESIVKDENGAYICAKCTETYLVTKGGKELVRG